MAFEVFADLPFRLGNEAETPAIAECATGGPDRKRACIPERAEPARRRIEFGKALLAPREVIELLVGSPLHLLFDRRVSRDGGMALVKALRGNFARVVHSHQARRMGTLFVVECSVLQAAGGVRARRSAGRARNGAQRIVGAGEQSIERGQ